MNSPNSKPKCSPFHSFAKFYQIKGWRPKGIAPLETLNRIPKSHIQTAFVYGMKLNEEAHWTQGEMLSAQGDQIIRESSPQKWNGQ